MKRNLVFKINVLLDVPEHYTKEDMVHVVRNMILEDGLSEYINEDTLIDCE